MKHWFSILAFSSACLFFTACDTDPQNNEIDYSTGMLVVNEGAFGQGNGSISHVNLQNLIVTQDLLSKENNGLLTGDIVQSVVSSDLHTYIVVNNSNMIRVVDKKDFKWVADFKDLALPRYLLVYQGHGYLTEWVNFGVAGKVSKINLLNGDLIAQASLGNLPENLLAHQNAIWVCNSGNSGVGSLQRLSPNSLEIIQDLDGGDNPSDLLVIDQKVWVLAGGQQAWTGNESEGSLTAFDANGNQLQRITLPLSQGHPFRLASANSAFLYYIAQGGIYRFNLNETSAPLSPFISIDNAYGLAVAPGSGNIMVGTAPSFAENGKVWIYSPQGTLLNSVNAEIAPNGFYFPN